MAPKTPASGSRHPSKEKRDKNKPPTEEEDDVETEEEPIAQEDGSDSDPDSDGSPSRYKIQPIPKPSSTLAKRAHEEEGDLTSCKKSKIEGKKPIFSSSGCITKLWSDDDEIAVLNGMIDFKKTKGVDPTSDLQALHGFVEGKLQGEFSREQLKTKINRLKKKFLKALKKGENGSDPLFSNAHEDLAFELSKKIWGGISEGGKKNAKGKEKKNAVVKEEKGKEKKNAVVKEEKQNGVKELDFWSKYECIRDSFDKLAVNFPSLAVSETCMSSVKEKMSVMGTAEAELLNEKWKKLIVEETELKYKMLTLMSEQLKMVFGQSSH